MLCIYKLNGTFLPDFNSQVQKLGDNTFVIE